LWRDRFLVAKVFAEVNISAKAVSGMETGMFDWGFRFAKLDGNGDPLTKLNAVIDWDRFRPTLQVVRDKARKSNAGRKPFDTVLMFKILILQSLYNLSDEAVEFQILDRISFMRFLGLSLGQTVPDAKTIWLFREQLTEAGLVEELFVGFDSYLRQSGFEAKGGQIIDASIVRRPKQNNTREENTAIKAGQPPAGWADRPEKARQKDTDARWVKKLSQNHFGYKNHLSIDVKHKLIRAWTATAAATHDSNVCEQLLDEANSSRAIWADAAYRSEKRIMELKAAGWRPHIQRKAERNHPLSQRERQGNRTRSRIRSRVEHIFGVQAQRAGDLVIRTVGLVRARAKIGLRNLAYNLDRYATLLKAAA